MDFLTILVTHLLWEHTPSCGRCHRLLTFAAFSYCLMSNLSHQRLVLDICCTKCQSEGKIVLSFPYIALQETDENFNFVITKPGNMEFELKAEDAIAEWELMLGSPAD